ncbi:MAG TPA: Rieske 2Fe-2S domain-containing protein [Polyangiaceae bacterium]|nr:Rieske 2Fe-2S domain-containing protein [Polyangiaceae bacterium]
MSIRKLVAKISKAELPPGTMKRVDYPPFNVLIVNLGGVPYAIDDTCTHAGESLYGGDLAGCQIACPAHGYVFDIRTGALLSPPGLCDDQRTFDVTTEADAFAIYDDVIELLNAPKTLRNTRRGES